MSAASERELLATTAALLDQGRRIDRLSRAMSVTALVSLLALGVTGAGSAASVAMLVVSVVIGVIELFFAMRVGFDAALFHRLAAATGAPDIVNLDGALATLGLASPERAGRSIEQRTVGACRLLYRQGALAVLQLVVLLAAALLLALI